MTAAPISLQDLRRRIYVKAKAEKHWRFWGLYVHVCKLETLRAAYAMAKENNGAPGIDGVTFEAIEEAGVEGFLVQLRDELVTRTYRPLRNRRVEIPKGEGKVRVLGIPAIRDRVVQGALKLIRGADLRGGLSRRVVWVSTEADRGAGGRPGGRGDRAEQDAGDRSGFGGLLRQRAA